MNRLITECNNLLRHFELKDKEQKASWKYDTVDLFFIIIYLKWGTIEINSTRLIGKVIGDTVKKLSLSIAQQKQLKIWLFVLMKKREQDTALESLGQR